MSSSCFRALWLPSLQRCQISTSTVQPMVCLRGHSLLLFVAFAGIARITCSSELPLCTSTQAAHSVPIPACKQFVKLLEDPQYCSGDQGRNCCIVLDAALINHCHCWQGFSSATQGLFTLLQQHCNQQHQQELPQTSEIKVFIGVLTGSSHAQQRQAGESACMPALTFSNLCFV